MDDKKDAHKVFMPQASDKKPPKQTSAMFVPGAQPKTISDPADIEQFGPIKSWSYSALTEFEGCNYRSYLKRVKKFKEPSGEAADRGTAIHQLAEDYVQGAIDELPKELTKKDLAKKFEWLKEQYKRGCVKIEEDWGFNTDWDKTGWFDDDVWVRVKLDALVFQSDTSAIAIDHKTGRMWGNEIKHNQQGLLYVIATFLRYPELEHVQTQFWYIDHGKIGCIQNYTRDQAMMFLRRWNKRAILMTTATDFPPMPSPDSCRWCRFKLGTDETEGAADNPKNPGKPVCEYGYTC